MELDELRKRCLDLPGASESRPFGPGALVVKVGGKIFAIIGEHNDPLTISLKCEPEIAQALRKNYDSVQAGYHLNKKHWNTVTFNGTVREHEVIEWIEDSYDLVLHSLSKKARDSIALTPFR